MFSNRIANSARFLQMPQESQLLYFHMVLRADDDGVVEAYPLMKLLNSAPDAFKVLIAKGYVKQLNEDQVIIIMDWSEHNLIRADRKVNSIYAHLIPKDIPILLPKPRSDVEDNSKRVGGQSTDGIGKVRLGKGKLSKDNKITAIAENDEARKVFDLFKEIKPSYEILFKRKHEWEAARRLEKQYGLPYLEKITHLVKSSNKMPYAPVITSPAELEEKMAKFEAFWQQRKGKIEEKNKSKFVFTTKNELPI